MCVEIYTSRAIGRQILRHRSFSFQEFSQRYAEPDSFEDIYARREHDENRQSSVDDLPSEVKSWWLVAQIQNEFQASKLYRESLKKGISRETARFLLPESSITHMYMHGNIRSWIHYLQLRTQDDVQLEHREVAIAITDIFKEQLPTLGEVLA
jgi:thymidylate synthase (FAD)